MTGKTAEQLAQELVEAKAKIDQILEENAKLKETESSLRSKIGSTSKVRPGSSLSSVIKQIDFSSLDADEDPEDLLIMDDPEGQQDGDSEKKLNLTLMMMQEIQRLNEKIVKIPGIPDPLEEVSQDSFADSPFADSIALKEIPKKFTVPGMSLYDGTTDPQDHIAQYKQRMLTIPIPRDLRETCLCKGFGSTLCGPALQWLVGIPNGTIKSFANLVNSFVQQFVSSRKLQKQTSDLYRIVQRFNEPLRDYLQRFNQEKISIPNCDIGTAIQAYRQGLVRDSELYRELAKYPCSTFEDVQAKTLAQNWI
ncbi:hypothetical protein RND81_02G199100 [Saponaria officinalis]|uniref:Retrotransposon gag domain-containing protein n=1 Tax=Saponaria officinalis TaxID=3572 RepID=A0AAW1MVU0_SAPOF